MMKCVFNAVALLLVSAVSVGQKAGSPAQNWTDSVYKTLSKDERIAQLMVVRLSSMDTKTRAVTFYDEKVAGLIKKYNIGGICIFQGSPVKQAIIINRLQAMAKTPILMCVDAEWGMGMRLIDSVLPLPRQMMLGAMKDETIVYAYGKLVAEQCKRFGIQVNYAPVVDINNNPDNPVINDRSFGEDKYKVAAFGIQYMKGMQDEGVMACAKHFPGHGDVNTDSHYDLPVINKSMAQLDSLELFPFRQIFAAGVGSVMLAHLYIPAIDKTLNRATSLSPQNINGLMRREMNYQGLTFTDALEMQGVKKFYPNGDAAVQSIIAGNDMLCLPDDIPVAVKKIKDAIKKKKITWAEIELHCKKILFAKYQYGLARLQPINTVNLTADLNSGVPAMRKRVAENAITLVAKNDPGFFPLRDTKAGDVAFLGLGISVENTFAKRMITDYNATPFYITGTEKTPDDLLLKLKKFRKIVIGIHGLSRFPANNFGLSKNNATLINALQLNNNTISFLFANAYALKNMCEARNMVVCYEDDEVIQETAADMLQGKLFYRGVLPVTVCPTLKFGHGIETAAMKPLFEKNDKPGSYIVALPAVDSITDAAVRQHATPGGVILVLKAGQVAYEKAFGNLTYDSAEPTAMTTVYDLASLTKIFSTTLGIMKLYEEGQVDLKKKLSDYLPETAGTDKQNITVEKLLLHEAGLEPFIPFYRETLDAYGELRKDLYSNTENENFNIAVAPNLYLLNTQKDTLYKRLLMSKVSGAGKYVYSDNDYIFLGKIIERISGQNISEYVAENFYMPMQLQSMGYDPLQRNPLSNIAPTENDKIFRRQLLRGYVHDEGAALMGGRAGHAGLFGNAYDAAALMQMLLNGGTFNGQRYLQKATIDLFTAYNSMASRRGYGFDKPEKDNTTRRDPYPSKSSSALTFGHTGFTGTAAWADPAHDLVYIFLSNRVYPVVNNLFVNRNVRVKVLDEIYAALTP